MATYRFIGDWAQHGSVTFTHLGQSFETAEVDARAIANDGVALIPEADFQFTDAECTNFPTAISRQNAPLEFHVKMKTALESLAKFREGGPKPVVAEQEPAEAPTAEEEKANV